MLKAIIELKKKNKIGVRISVRCICSASLTLPCKMPETKSAVLSQLLGIPLTEVSEQGCSLPLPFHPLLATCWAPGAEHWSAPRTSSAHLQPKWSSGSCRESGVSRWHEWEQGADLACRMPSASRQSLCRSDFSWCWGVVWDNVRMENSAVWVCSRCVWGKWFYL